MGEKREKDIEKESLVFPVFNALVWPSISAVAERIEARVYAIYPNVVKGRFIFFLSLSPRSQRVIWELQKI